MPRTPNRAALVVNAASRTGAEAYERARKRLEQLGTPIEEGFPIKDPTRLGEVLDELAAREFDLVVVGGGDGTLSTAVSHLARHGITLGILPLGTANDLARTLQIPTDVDAACETIAHGKLVDIDVGRMGDDHRDQSSEERASTERDHRHGAAEKRSEERASTERDHRHGAAEKRSEERASTERDHRHGAAEKRSEERASTERDHRHGAAEKRSEERASTERDHRHFFLNVASIGLSVGVVRTLTPRTKRRLGPLAYPLATLRAYRAHTPFTAYLEFPDGDHEPLRVDDTLQVAIGNGRHYGGGQTMSPTSGIDDHSLDVYAIPIGDWRHRVWVARRLRDGTFVEHENVVHLTTRRVRLHAEPEQPINLDGEVVASTPQLLEVDRNAVDVLVPQDSTAASREGDDS